MKNIIISGMMLIVASNYAYADPIKMTLEKAATLENTLANGMNGVSASAGVTAKPYKLSANATYAIAIDVGRLEPAIKAYQAALKAKTDELTKSHPEDVIKGSSGSASPFTHGSPTEKLLSDEMQALWEKEQDFDLMTIPLADLNIGVDPDKQNQIPVGTVAALMPIIKP